MNAFAFTCFNNMADKKKNTTQYPGVIRQVGQNYLVKDTPCLVPKENMKFFTRMQKTTQQSSFPGWPNPYDAFWKKPGK